MNFLKGFFLTWYFWSVMILVVGIISWIYEPLGDIVFFVMIGGFVVYLGFLIPKWVKEWNIRRKMPKGN